MGSECDVGSLVLWCAIVLDKEPRAQWPAASPAPAMPQLCVPDKRTRVSSFAGTGAACGADAVRRHLATGWAAIR